MLYVSIGLFAVSAVLGLTILIKWLTKKEASRGVVYSHGIIAAVALVLLLVYASFNPDNFPVISITIFAIAALAGFYLFYTDVTKKPHPVVLACIHGLTAVAGVITLLMFMFQDR
jgi:hypothetical protein